MQDGLSEVVLILVGSTLIILLLTGLIVFALFIGQKRRFLHRQQITDIKYQYEQEVLKTQLETQAQTFETISQELHDNVGTLVSLAIVHLRQASEKNEADKNIGESGKLLDEALTILRDISKSMNVDHISRIGLANAFREELNRIERTKVFRTGYNLKGDEFSIAPQHQMIIFRIIQEALNNIVKHSDGDLVTMTVSFETPFLEVLIEDNGRGFDMKTVQASITGSGLSNMVKRARIIEASLDISSEKDRGTRVHLIYPSPARRTIP